MLAGDIDFWSEGRISIFVIDIATKETIMNELFLTADDPGIIAAFEKFERDFVSNTI